jgi:hypothetical protein
MAPVTSDILSLVKEKQFILSLGFRTTLFPYWNEWVCVMWVSGLLLGELTNPQDLSGLASIKIVIIILNIIATGIHIACFFLDEHHWPLFIYIR